MHGVISPDPGCPEGAGATCQENRGINAVLLVNHKSDIFSE